MFWEVAYFLTNPFDQVLAFFLGGYCCTFTDENPKKAKEEKKNKAKDLKNRSDDLHGFLEGKPVSQGFLSGCTKSLHLDDGFKMPFQESFHSDRLSFMPLLLNATVVEYCAHQISRCCVQIVSAFRTQSFPIRFVFRSGKQIQVVPSTRKRDILQPITWVERVQLVHIGSSTIIHI